MGISITGLASGLDTAQMVSDLMELERVPYKSLETKKSNLQSEQSIFRNINTSFRSLETALNNLRYASDWKKLKATSDSNVISVSSNSAVSAGSYSINVGQLATKNVVEISAQYMLDKVDEAYNNTNSPLKIGSYTFTQEDLESVHNAGSGIQDNDPIIESQKKQEAQLQKLAQIINTQTSATDESSGATASVLKTSSSGDFKLILNSKETGADNSVSFTLDGNNVIGDSTDVKNKLGQDAELVVNGVSVTRSSNTFDDLINGVTFTINGTGSSNVEISQDVENIVANVKNFVSAYNNLIGLVKNNLSKPTDDTKMNPLQGDALLRQIDTELYNVFNTEFLNSGEVRGEGTFMEWLGLSIDKGVKTGSLMTGKITLDESTFKNALANDPEKVIGAFTNTMPAEGSGDTRTAGVIIQLLSSVNKYASAASGLLSNKVAGYDAEIKFVNDRMDQMTLRLDKVEARLKQQFSTMEIMLSSLQSQQKWLTSQFDSLLKSNSK